MKNILANTHETNEVHVYAIEGLRLIRKSMKTGAALPCVMIIKDDCCDQMMSKMEKRVRKIVGRGIAPKLYLAQVA